VSFAFLPDDFWVPVYNLHALTFPPRTVAGRGIPAIRAYLLAHNHPLKIMLLILAARRRRARHPPPELWGLIFEYL